MIVKKSIYIPILILLFLFQGFLKNLYPKPTLNISKEEISLNFNDTFLEYSKLGHGRFLGAITWVMTLLESDIEHYKEDGNSWMFYRFRSISIYDPKFYENYLYGGQYLSIIKDDISGASQIYKKGLEYYPNDFWLNYHAGFHFYFEANDKDSALRSYEVLTKHKDTATIFAGLPTILAKLRVESGDLKKAFSELNQSYKELPTDSRLKAKFHSTLYSIKAKGDLNCLNSHITKKKCEYLDFDGIPYENKKGIYTSKRNLTPIILKTKFNR